MTILILGGGGFIGGRVAPWLAKAGVEAIGASRGGGDGRLALDRRDVAAVRSAIAAHGVTTVIDVWALTLPDTEPLLAGLDGHVERYVLISSADVYRNYDGLRRVGDAPPLMGPQGEASPLREHLYAYRGSAPRAADDPAAWMDDYDKIPIEAALRSRPGLDGVVLRLPMVYGPGDRQRRFAWIAGPLARGETEVGAATALLDWTVTYGYVEDVASAIAAAAIHPAAGGLTFNVGEADPVPNRVWAERFARLGGREITLRDGPIADGSPLAALDLSFPFVLDTTAIRETLGWREPTTLDEALAATYADEAARG